MLCSLDSEVAGDLVAEGAVLVPQAGDLGPGGVEPLAERVAGCAARGGRRLVMFAQLADEVADLVLAVEPGPGDALLTELGLEFQQFSG